ncbi:MAG: hypothetical protein ACUVTH_15320, partial [Thermogutta sp.]
MRSIIQAVGETTITRKTWAQLKSTYDGTRRGENKWPQHSRERSQLILDTDSTYRHESPRKGGGLVEKSEKIRVRGMGP